MKKFLYRSALFLVIFSTGWVSVYIALNNYLNRNTEGPGESIYIWGDSQTALGLNLRLLNKLTGKKVLSAALYGCSVYDFLVFAEKIPVGSTVIVGLSKPVQIRPKEGDFNLSGLSLNALFKMHENNYSIAEIWNIIYVNKLPRAFFSSENLLGEYSDSSNVVFEPLEVFEKIYSVSPEQITEKQNLYYAGFEMLAGKKCKIIVVDFPFHPALAEVEKRSKLKTETDKFENNVRALLKIDQIDTLKLNPDKNVFFDYSHLNVVGADSVTNYIGKSIDTLKRNMLIKPIK